MATYDVYFEQVNQTKIQVNASSVEDAVIQAKKIWKQQNGPHLVSVECRSREES